MRDGLSASDVALLSGRSGNNGDGMFGDNGAWWVIIFLIFAFMGWGRNNNGFGGGGNDGGNTIPFFQSLDTDFATLERKLDTIQAGICDSTFALNNTIVNGNNAIQSTLCQGFSGVNQNLVTQGYETRIGINGLGAELANCCCQLKEGIAGINYNMAMNTNNLQNSMCLNTRDIIDNINANYRSLHDEIVANRIEDKNAQITAQQNEINALRLKASQEAQSNYIISQLNPCAKPSYVVNAPTPVNFPTNCCGTFTGFNTCGTY